MHKKSTQRIFEVKNYLKLQKAVNWANEVLNSIETDELLVFDHKDPHAFDVYYDNS